MAAAVFLPCLAVSYFVGGVHPADICRWTSVGLIAFQKGVRIEAWRLKDPLPPFLALMTLLE